jgi:hypothetical protein
MIFAYLRMLSASGPPTALLSEYASLAATGFAYAEPSEPEAFATQASSNLPFYPPTQWLSGPATVAPGGEEGVAHMLKITSDPKNAMITLVAKANEPMATLTEPIYGTKYGKLPLTREVEAWRTSQLPAGLAPPLPNPFVPDVFTIKAPDRPPPAKSEVAPLLLRDTAGLRVHFLQDATFRRPKANAYFLFRSNVMSSSAKASITAQLFQSIFGASAAATYPPRAGSRACVRTAIRTAASRPHALHQAGPHCCVCVPSVYTVRVPCACRVRRSRRAAGLDVPSVARRPWRGRRRRVQWALPYREWVQCAAARAGRVRLVAGAHRRTHVVSVRPATRELAPTARQLQPQAAHLALLVPA